MKRVLSLFLSCIFVLGVCFSTPIVASATGGDVTVGDATEPETLVGEEFDKEYYTYKILRDAKDGALGTCALIKYSGTFKDTTIPESVSSDNGGLYTITQISAGAFSECKNLQTLTIKSNIETIEAGAFVGCKTLTAFIESVDSENVNFEVIDGVLFNQNKTTLIAYPAVKEGAKYTIPADVEEIATGAFNGANVTLLSANPGEITANPDGLIIHNVIAEGEHNVNYVDAGNKIIVKCDGCSEKFGTITLEAPVLPDGAESLVYDGTAKEATVKVEGITGLDEIPAVSYGVDEESNQITPINAGTYTATLTIENVTVTKEFTVEKAPVIITANSQKIIKNNTLEFKIADVTVEGLVYGDELSEITITPNTDGKEVGENFTLTPSGAIIKKGDNDVTANYEVAYTAGTLNVTDCDGHTGGEATCVNQAICDKCHEGYDGLADHSWEFVASEATITATCQTDGCAFNTDPVEITLTAPSTGLVYDGTAKTADVTVSAENSGIEIPEIEYSGDRVNVTEDGYTATIKLGESENVVIATINLKITPKQLTDNEIVVAGIENSYVYTGSYISPEISVTDNEKQLVSGTDYTVNYSDDIINAGTVTVTVTGIGNYTGEVKETYTIEPKEITATLTQDSGVYNGNTHQPTVKISGLCGTETLTNGTDFTVEYSDNINVGAVTVTVTLEETSVAKNYTFANNAKTTTLNYTITAGVASIKTAPTVKTGLVYTGSAQELVTAGEATNGTMQYRLSENESWSTDIPTATNAGTYKIYYKVVGDKNYSDSDVASVDVAIAKATPTTENFKIDLPTNLIFNGDPKTVTMRYGADIGAVTVDYYRGETKLETAPTEPGTYTVKLQVKGNNNYNSVTLENGAWNFTIIACEHKWENGVCKTCNTECEHEFESPEITKNPTCNAPGELTWVCTICKHTKVTTVNPNGDGKTHDWSGDYIVTKAATCVSEGVETKTCKNGCGEKTTRQIAIDTEAHVMGEWVTTEQTCVADGKKVRSCTLGCGATETEVIKADNKSHKLPDEWTVTKEVNCVEDGEKIKACLNEGCTYVAKESIPADGKSHNLGEWEVTIPAKCTVKGEVTQYCQNGDCTHKVTASLKPDGKNHDPAEEFTVVPATCVSAGEKYKKCQNPDCTAKLESEELPLDPESHVNTEVINAKEATCLEAGYTGDTFCKDCEKTIVSGVVVDAKGHTASEWIVDKEATFEEEGAQHKECTVCKEELQKAVIEKRSLDTPVVKIENAGNGIKVTWSQDEDATGYTVYRSTYNAKTKKWSKWVNRGTADATKSSWVDKKVEHGVTYKFTVRAINDKYKSAYKETGALLYVVAPKVTCSITSTGILVNWNKIDNADSYDVYRSVLVDGAWVKWAKIGTTKAEKNTFLDDKVESGVNYKYTVRAVDGKVKSGYVSSASIIYLSQPVLKISNSANGVTGNWGKIEGATGYTIYRSEYNPSIKKWTKWLNLGTTKATAKSFTDKTVKSGYKYKYTIRAINGELKSTYVDSNQLIFLAQPTLKIANTAAGIQGKWDKVDGATGYILYRSELKEDGSWTKWITLGTAKATAKSFTDKTVKSGVTYKYTIRAKNGNYKSSYVDSNSSIFLSIPTVKIANSETGVKVSWGKIDGATNYLVYRSEYNSKTKKWSKWKTLETVDITSFVDETAVSNVKYKYTVRALNGEFRSYFTASAELLYLKAPTVTAEKTDEGIKVSWTKIEGATSYIIYRSELSEDGKWSKWTKLGTAGEKYTSCKDKTVKEDVTYKYTVRAVNGKLMSYYVAGEQILNGVVTESTPEEPKTDVVA